MKRAVITGPTGSIGIALINELVANGIEVLAVVRPGSMRADRIKESSLVKRADTGGGRCILPLWLGWHIWRQP